MPKYCSSCGKELVENSKFCPSCGKPTLDESQIIPVQTPTEDTTSAYFVYVVAVMLLVAGIFLIFYSEPGLVYDSSYGDYFEEDIYPYRVWGILAAILSITAFVLAKK